MNQIKVYDIPTRIFHWTFVFLFVSAFIIAKTIDDESPLYPYHMLLGLTLGLAVLLRIVWGLVGSKYAKFGSFHLSIQSVTEYFKSFKSSAPVKYVGHNPASSWAALLMMVCALGLAGTGILMAKDINKDFYEDIHELFGNAFVLIAIGHVLGIALHTLRHKEMIGLSMIHGEKVNAGKDAGPNAGIQSSHAFVGLIFVAIIAAFGIQLNKNYDSASQTLNFLGTTLQLGENENDEAKGDKTENEKTENETAQNPEEDGDSD